MNHEDHPIRSSPVFHAINGALFHVTSIAALKRILHDGYIRPNTGQFDYTYPQSENSCANDLGAVSLFDFSISDEEIFEPRTLNWSPFLFQHGPVNAMVRLDEDRIRDGLLSNQEMRDRGDGYCTVIANVEVGHMGEIPIEVNEGAVFVCVDNHDIYRGVSEPVIDKKTVFDVMESMRNELLECGWNESVHLMDMEVVTDDMPDGDIQIIESPPDDDIGWYRRGDRVIYREEDAINMNEID